MTLDTFPDPVHSLFIKGRVQYCFVIHQELVRQFVSRGFSIGAIDVLCNKIHVKLIKDKFTNQSARNKGFSQEKLVYISLAILSYFFSALIIYSAYLEE